MKKDKFIESINKYKIIYKIEIAFVLLISIGIFLFSKYIDLFERFKSLLQSYEVFYLDELFFPVLFVLGCVIFFSIRRYVEIKEEIARSLIAHEKLIKTLREKNKVEEYLRIQEFHAKQILSLIKKLEYSTTYDEMLLAIKKVLQDVLGYETVWYYKFSKDKKTSELVFAGEIPNFIHQNELLKVNIDSEPYYQRIANSVDIDIVDDACLDEFTSSKKFIKDLKIHTLVHIPLKMYDSTIGLLGTGTFGDQGVKKPTDVELEFLKNMSGHVALSLHRIHLQQERTLAELALKTSEIKYRNIIEQSNHAIYLQKDGLYEVVNENFLKLFGITRAEAMSDNFSLINYAHPSSMPLLEERRRKANAGEDLPNTYEFTVITQDKGILELEASISYVLTEGKLQTQGILRDISTRKRSERIQVAIYQISESANSTNNLKELIYNIHQIVKTIMYAENFYVVFYNLQTDSYSLPYFVDQIDVVEEENMNLQGSLTDYIRRTEKAAIIDENMHAELVASGEAKYILQPAKSWMGAPLKTPSGVIGVIAVQSYESCDEYSKEDLELLNLISGQIARALEKKKADDEIEKSREFFKTVIDSLDNPLYVMNIVDSTIAVANTAAKRLIFTENSDKRDCYGGIIKDSKCCNCYSNSCPIAKLLRTKKPVKFEHTITHINNDENIYEVYAFPILDSNGEIIQVIENLVDISERKKFENKLSELAVFPEANPNIVMRINPQQEITYMNSATSTILGGFGISRKNINTCFPENLSELIKNMMIDGCGMQDLKVEINSYILSWSFHPVVGQDIIHCYAHDITKQVKQTEEINKLSMVATHSSNLVMITDTNGRIEYVNPYFTHVTGYAKDEVVGKKIGELKSGANSSELYKNLWQTITSGKTWNGKIKNLKKNSEAYWESKTISPIINEDGDIISYISVGNDITKEIHIQNQLVESEKFSAIATLAAGVAHEFKNYLGGIIGNASFSVDEIDSEDGLSLAKETLINIIDMGEKANDVAMSLLTFSKAQPDDLQKEDLKKIINKSIKLIEKELETLSIEVATCFDQCPLIEVSLSKIQQLLLNLFINAKHAIQSNGVITVALLNKGDHIEIRVGDSGGGIAKEHLDKIFDPFYSTKGVWGEDKVSGTGMGLSICRNIALEHNGDLTVETIRGVGTAFILTLPISKEHRIEVQNDGRYDGKNIILFTLDKSIANRYKDDIQKSHMDFQIVDQYEKLDQSIMKNTAFVICDAKFSAKLELYRIIEMCIQNNQPYIMINCGTMEYQLAELYEDSVVNYKEFPDFNKIFSDFETLRNSKILQSKL